MSIQDEYRQKFNKQKERLISLIDRTAKKLDEYDFKNNLGELKNNVESGIFSIVVIGEFSSGKSTFLNALMGEKYLPSYKRETTATINYIRHKEHAINNKCLVIHYNDGRQPESFDEPSFDIIKKYTTTEDKEQLNVAKEINHIDLYLDSKFLNDNTILVDTPGLNGIEEGLFEITQNEISKSHSCIYLFNANAPGTKTDFDFLNDLNKKFNSIIIVLNQIDQIKEDEGETIESVVESLKANYIKQIPDAKIPEIYPMSALKALIARHPRDGEVSMPGDNKKIYSKPEKDEFLVQSNIESFENRLWKFLTESEKTKNQILEPLKKVKELVDNKLKEKNEENEDLKNKEDTNELQKEIERYEDEIKNINDDLAKRENEISTLIEDNIENAVSLLTIKSKELEEKFQKKVDYLIDQEDYNKDDIDEFARNIGTKLNNDYVAIIEEIERKFRSDIRRDVNNAFSEKVSVELNLKDINKEDLKFNNMSELNFEASYEEIDKRLKELELTRKELDKEIDKDNIELAKTVKASSEYEKTEAEIKRLKEERRNLNILYGHPPGKDIRTEIEYEEEKIKGVWGAIKYVAVGRGEVKKEKIIIDDSAQKQYEEKMKQHEQKLEDELNKLNEKLKSSSNGMTPEEIKLLKEIKEREKKELREEEEKIIKDYDKKYQEFIKRAKKKIKYYLEDKIEDLKKYGSKHVEEYFESNKDNLTKTVKDSVSVSVRAQLNEKINRLEDRKMKLSKSVDEKNQIIENNAKIISDLEPLSTDINKMLIDMENMEIDIIRTV